MKANRVVWSVTGAFVVALLTGTLASGETATTNVPPSPAVVLIKAGTNSGTDPDAGDYSLTVTDSFYMDKHEVTKALWDEVYTWAVAHGYGFDSGGSGKATNHPVQSINWYDCVKWCNARSEKEGRPACYTVGGNVQRGGKDAGFGPQGLRCETNAPGYRLPTDVEWEYAARGGLKGKRFPWGDEIDHDKENYLGHPSFLDYDKGYEGYDNRHATGPQPYTAPVGSFPANAYGLHDMVGNVREWCWEWSPAHMGAHRILRGSAWSYSADYGRLSSTSGNMYPEFSYWSVGFRCVMTQGK